MIKRDIVTRVSMKMGIPKVKAELAVESVFQVLKAAMHNGSGSNSEGSVSSSSSPAKAA